MILVFLLVVAMQGCRHYLQSQEVAVTGKRNLGFLTLNPTAAPPDPLLTVGPITTINIDRRLAAKALCVCVMNAGVLFYYES